jgi:hypothetical protein
MLMNATRMQTHILNTMVEIYRHIGDKVQHRKEIRDAKRVFRQIMLCDCAERDWLVWYIYVEREFGTYKNYLLRFDSPDMWTGAVGAFVTSKHKLFVPRNTTETGGWLPFTKKIRDEIGDSEEWFQSKKEFMGQVNIVASNNLTL